MSDSAWSNAVLADGIHLVSGRHIEASAWNTDGIGMPYLTGPEDFRRRRIDVTKFVSRPDAVCESGDILLVVKGSGTGKMIRADKQYCISRQLMAIRSSIWSNNFLEHFIRTHEAYYSSASAGLIPGISRSDILQTPVSLPPLSGQRKIDRILTTVDNLIEQTEALIEKYKSIKQGMMHDLFTRGVDSTGRLRPPYEDAPHLYKQSPLGWIPKEWEVVRLDDVSAAIVDCPHSTPEYLADGVLVARTSQIKDGRFESASASFVSEAENCLRIARLEPQAGDLIFTREAPVGEAFVIPARMRICLGQRVMLIRLNTKRCASHFILSLIYSSGVRRRFDQQTGGTTNPHLNVKDVRNLRVVIPSFEEQVLISKQILSLVAKVDTEMKYLGKLRLQKTGLMQDLLTGKVRVNVDEAEEVTADV